MAAVPQVVVGGWESEQELAVRSSVLKNAWICSRTSFSWVHHSLEKRTIPHCRFTFFVKIRGSATKCSDGLFPAVLMRHYLHFADRSYLPWDQASKHSLSLSSLLLSMPCWAGMPYELHIFTEVLLNKDSVWKCYVYFVSCCLHADCSSWQATCLHLVSISCLVRFQLQCFLPSYLVSPAFK